MIDQACIFNIQKFSLHDGPGIRTVVFFKGCPLNCFWCSNPESQSGQPESMWDKQNETTTIVGEYKTIAEIVVEVMKDEPFYEESGGGVTLSGGEVLYQAEFATELARQLKAKGIHTTSETAGFAKIETFKKYIGQIDLLYFDVKHHNEEKHKEGTGVSLKPILHNLSYALKEHNHLIVRIPVIPNYNDGPENAKAFAVRFNEIGVKKIELLPFHQFGEQKYSALNRQYTMLNIPQLHTEDLDYFQEIIQRHGISCTIN